MKKANFVKITADLEKGLKIIDSENDNYITKTESSIKLIFLALKKIRKLSEKLPFKNSAEEIYFFKYVKPRIHSKLIYCITLFNIEQNRPVGCYKLQKKYLNSEIKKLQKYFKNNMEFYQYFKRGESYLDKYYFQRNKKFVRIHLDSLNTFLDDTFATTHDTSVAKFIGYEMLISKLQNEIVKLENKIPLKTKIKSNLNWTGNKVDLVELIYALYAVGIINKGSADIKELASLFQNVFNIELGDYYRTFLEIRSRKMNNTKFLDLLKESLLNRIEESDE